MMCTLITNYSVVNFLVTASMTKASTGVLTLNMLMCFSTSTQHNVEGVSPWKFCMRSVVACSVDTWY